MSYTSKVCGFDTINTRQGRRNRGRGAATPHLLAYETYLINNGSCDTL